MVSSMENTSYRRLHFVVIFVLFVIMIDFVSSFETTLPAPVYNINFHIPSPDIADVDSRRVYWKSLESAFKKNPEAIKSALLISYLRKRYPSRVYVDQFGQQYTWNPNHGFVLITHSRHQASRQYQEASLNGHRGNVNTFQRPPFQSPVFWAQTPQGWIPVSPDPFFISYSSYPANINNYWCDPTMTDFNSAVPQLASDEGLVDPCMRQQLPDEFGLVSSSGMADILCAFCQTIKSMECVWKFCSHPDGIYKVKLKYK